MNLSAGEVTSRIIFYGILLIVGTTALSQAGVETAIITANISIIIGGVLLAFAIGFGYSSRDLLTNILSSFYARNTYAEGQIIRIDNIQGKITKIDRIQTIISTDSGELIIPNRRLISETIERLTTRNRTSLQHQPTSKQ
ncbi:MAG: mechanosensitive ion channel [Fodinibius sp.]|nr:mechanosensitive ion channel [Fodinibius sp.]